MILFRAELHELEEEGEGKKSVGAVTYGGFQRQWNRKVHLYHSTRFHEMHN